MVESSLDPARAPVRLGHHVLLHELGSGGMGVVYAAYDVRLDRRVAIKLLQPKKGARSGARLIREAQALARLSHPNVVQIYEIGEFEGQPFLVMELIDGVTLDRWLAKRPTRAEILTVFLAAGCGLAAAHAKGLIHRDFKPENVMLRGDGQVVVMDFGLARGDECSGTASSDEHEAPSGELSSGELSSGHSSELERPLTIAGAVIGTVGYMAPEQAVGERVQDRCDQFSFCVALWEALYGKRPFRDGDIQEFMRSVVSGPPTPREPNDVPMWLRQVLERGLARNPDDRWPSMDDLLDALRRDPTRRRRHRLAAVGSLALVAAIAVEAYMADQRELERAEQRRVEQIAACELEGQAILQDWNEEVATAIERAFMATKHSTASEAWQHTRPWFDSYTREWSALRAQICVETTVDKTRNEDSMALAVDCLDEGRMFLVGMLETLTSLGPEDASMVPSATSTAARLQPPALCTNEALLQHRQLTPPELRDELAELRLDLERARVRQSLGDYERALREAQAVIVGANQLGWTPLAVQAGHTASSLQVRLGKYDEAKHTAQQAFWAAAGDTDPLAMLVAATELARVFAQLTDFEEAHGWAMLAKTLLAELELAGTVAEAVLLERLAFIASGTGDNHGAVMHQTRVVEIYEALLGPRHPVVGKVVMNLGNYLGAAGSRRADLESKYRALEILEAALGPQHADVGTLLHNIGAALAQLGEYERALDFEQRSLAISEATLGREHPMVAYALEGVGTVLCQRGECEEALEYHRRALGILETSFGTAHPDVADAYQTIAMTERALGSHEEALAHFRQALSILEAKHGPEHPSVLSLRIDIAATLGKQGHIELAIEQLRSALDQLERQGDLDSAFSTGLAEYGLLLLEHGDVVAARESLERALELYNQQGLTGVSLANARFALARALATGGEHARAHELADEAEADYWASGPFGARELAELQTWRRNHPRKDAIRSQ